MLMNIAVVLPSFVPWRGGMLGAWTIVALLSIALWCCGYSTRLVALPPCPSEYIIHTKMFDAMGERRHLVLFAMNHMAHYEGGVLVVDG